MSNRMFGILAGALLLTQSAGAAALPAAHLIAGVPWHVQQNDLSCGDGALEIAYDYWGADVDQKEIADVARTSSIGTWSFDILRARQFSGLSAAQGAFYPAYSYSDAIGGIGSAGF